MMKVKTKPKPSRGEKKSKASKGKHAGATGKLTTDSQVNASPKRINDASQQRHGGRPNPDDAKLAKAVGSAPTAQSTANQRKRARKRALKLAAAAEAAAGTRGEQSAKKKRKVEEAPVRTAAAVTSRVRKSAWNGGEHGETRLPAAEGVGAEKGRAPAANGTFKQPINSSKESPIASGSKAKGADSESVGPAVITRPAPTGNTNWAALKATIGAGKRRRDVRNKGSLSPAAAEAARRPLPTGSETKPTRVLAVDCEMVGVGPDGARSSLARVSIVNDQGNVLLDKFVLQKERVTDFRTQFSGVRPADVREGNAVSLEEVQETAAGLFKNRIIVGHSIQNDLKALLLSHPRKLIRDTARFPPLMRATAPGRKPRSRALRHLAFEVLGLGIQEGEHSPIEDARAALYLYQRYAKEWERSLRTGTIKKLKPALPGGGHTPDPAKTLAALAANDVMVDL